ncbi:MAG: hypothetical protein JNL10_17155 [Verrucomicrobiales bacterium]|nr:hypothetical protein [Verrucomicrobiales bacterium]
MRILKILHALQSVVGFRTEDTFPNRPASVEFMDRDGDGPRAAFVHRIGITRRILEDGAFEQMRFLDDYLALCDPRRTEWIRYFMDHNPEFLNGEVHRDRSRLLRPELARCVRRLDAMPVAGVAALVDGVLASERPSTFRIARAVTAHYFSACLQEISGTNVSVDEEVLFGVDIFLPFPRPAHLHACNQRVDSYIAAVRRIREPSPAELIVLLTLLMMGTAPTVATVNWTANRWHRQVTSGTASGSPPPEVDFSLAPTSFVMRRCVEDTEVEGHSFEQGDVVYLFLGEASGCPLHRLNSLPFGAGRHTCSGQPLSRRMLELTHAAFGESRGDWNRAVASGVVPGRSSAFVKFEDVTA